ncbi:MAG TPA: glycoside hydrolase family 30 protein [Chitinivibrionales bacterium]|nr:glycoside hydrolase family 30 protein [Chitinivibrionales bacterium]
MAPKKTLLLAICFVMIGSAFAQQVTWMRSSSGGDKMKMQTLSFHAAGTTEPLTVTVNPAQTYQTMVGFGGSFTDAGAWALNYLSATDRAAVEAAYFGPTGANYEVCRSQMGASDFSAVLYSYDDNAGDYSLSKFSVAHDQTYILQWEKEAMGLNPDLKIFGSPWSAPGWMKSNGNMDNGGSLLANCDTTWALYFVKWYQAYKAFGVTPWGVTIQNEPAATQSWPSMIFSDVQERDFMKNYLGPMLARNNLGPNVLNVMFLDHNRDMMVQWANTFYSDATVTPMVWGEAIHWYDYQNLFSAVNTVYTTYKSLGKHILATEQCITGFNQSNPESWQQSAENYAHDIWGDCTNGSEGWVDWNMILNQQGGPNLSSNWCDAGILINTAAKTYTMRPVYYAMAQYSKYVRTGAVRIGTTLSGSYTPEVMAFKNPDSSYAVIVHNPANASYNGRVVIGSNQIEYATTPYSIDDFFWYPGGVPVINNKKPAGTVHSSAKSNLSAWRQVMGLDRSDVLGPEAYTVSGKRVLTSPAGRVTPGVYVTKPGQN